MPPASPAFDPPPALEAPLVDLWVHQDFPITLAELTARLQQTRLPRDQAQVLIAALQRSTRVQIGASVPKAEADTLQQEFQSQGLNLVLIPVLTLAPIERVPVVPYEKCPACGQSVHLSATRQCPACQVQVDSVPIEAQLKHKLQQEERERLLRLQAKRAQMEEEDRLRAEIRAELEAKMGLKDSNVSVWGGRDMTLIKVAAWMALTGGLMGIGYGLHAVIAPAPEAQSLVGVDKMLAVIATDAGQDPGHRGGSAPTPAPPGVIPPQDESDSLGHIAQQAESSPENAALPPTNKVALKCVFAVELARFGQAARANEILGQLQASSDVAENVALRSMVSVSEWQVRAWSLPQQSSSTTALNALKDDLARLNDPLERAMAAGRVGRITATIDNLPWEATLALLSSSGDTLKRLPDSPARAHALQDWMNSLGQALTQGALRFAKAGQWTRAKALAQQLDAVVAQAGTGEAHLPLLALQVAQRRGHGLGAEADQALAAFWREVDRLPSSRAKADALLAFAEHSGQPRHPQLLDRVAMVTQAAGAEQGEEAAQALNLLGLVHALNGQEEDFRRVLVQMRAVTGLPPEALIALNAEQTVNGGLALARSHRAAGQHGQEEAQIEKVAIFLR